MGALSPARMMEEFYAGSPMHVLVVIAVTLLSYGLIRARRPTGLAGNNPVRFDRRLALILLVLWVALTVCEFLVAPFRWDKCLPLHICDITGLVAPIALWTGRRLPRSILFFWGIGLSTQAFIMPMLYLGPAHLDFWTYVICHAAIVSAAVYDSAARGYRPCWQDWQNTVLFSATYLLFVMGVNIRLGVNYGYMGRTNVGQAAFVMALGEWPARVPRLVGIVWMGMAGMVLIGNQRPVVKPVERRIIARPMTKLLSAPMSRPIPAGRRAA